MNVLWMVLGKILELIVKEVMNALLNRNLADAVGVVSSFDATPMDELAARGRATHLYGDAGVGLYDPATAQDRNHAAGGRKNPWVAKADVRRGGGDAGRERTGHDAEK